jgi:sucrose-phosphate synthase
LHLLRGDEREVLRPILDLIEANGLRSSVSFLNIGSQRQLACAYRQFGRMGSVFALPSLFEPFGLGPIEAAACGLAVAATKNGGPSEIFAGGAGILFDPDRPADIARALLETLGAHETLVRMSTERVRTRYTWERTAERYLEQININLQSPRPQRPDLGRAEPDASKLISNYLGSL